MARVKEILVFVKHSQLFVGLDARHNQGRSSHGLSAKEAQACRLAVKLGNQIGATTRAICVGNRQAEATLREALSLGIGQGTLLKPSDAATCGLSSISAVAAFVSSVNYCLILLGDYSIDRGSGLFAPMLSGHLKIDYYFGLSTLTIVNRVGYATRKSGTLKEELVFNLPCVASIAAAATDVRGPLSSALTAAVAAIEVVQIQVELDARAEILSFGKSSPVTHDLQAPSGTQASERIRSIIGGRATGANSRLAVSMTPHQAAKLILDEINQIRTR